jgi:hypothetical protein
MEHQPFGQVEQKQKAVYEDPKQQTIIQVVREQPKK